MHIAPWAVPFALLVTEVENMMSVQPSAGQFGGGHLHRSRGLNSVQQCCSSELSCAILDNSPSMETELRLACMQTVVPVQTTRSPKRVRPADESDNSVYANGSTSNFRNLSKVCARMHSSLKVQTPCPELSSGQSTAAEIEVCTGQMSHDPMRMILQESGMMVERQKGKKLRRGPGAHRAAVGNKRSAAQERKKSSATQLAADQKAIVDGLLSRSSAWISFSVRIGGSLPTKNLTPSEKQCYYRLFVLGTNVCCNKSDCVLHTSRDIHVLGPFQIMRHRRPYKCERSGKVLASFSATWTIGKQLEVVVPLASTVSTAEITSFLALQKALNRDDSAEAVKKYNLP